MRHGAPGETSPPPFLRLAGHPLRWRLLSELARSDRRVGELCALAGRRQSLVSYHLRQLRDGGLVSARRSTADGRDTYYVLDLARCGELLASAGAALHPGLAPTRATRRARPPARAGAVPVHRQQRALADGRGALRATVRRRGARGQRGQPPQAAASQRGARDARPRHRHLAASRTKHLSEFAGQRFDYVITLCDRVREVCPEFPGAPEPIHWSIPDPAREPGGDEETLPAFERTAAELETRIGFLIAAINATTAGGDRTCLTSS